MNSVSLRIKICLFFVLIYSQHFVNCSIDNNRIDKYVSGNDECKLSDAIADEIKSYQPIVNEIFDRILNGEFAGSTWKSLDFFIDKFGPRLSGSVNLENAIDYMLHELTAQGLENVHSENATVPHWERGYEHAELISPRKQTLPILGLGGSIGTPRGGIISDVIVVETFDELRKLPDALVSGKIVVFAPKWQGYGKTVAYRSSGAVEAAKKGAKAALLRSITPFSIGSPHTGQQHYADGVKKIPFAALTVEDATMLLGMYRRGESISISLEMEARNFNDNISRNTIGELQGSNSSNDSVVVVSGHLDSWDVGSGAMDDGGGAFISWKAVEFLKKMNLRPKRTIRAILWTGEEEGLFGARAYMEGHRTNEQKEFNFFIESDMGTFEPLGLGFNGNKDAECILEAVMDLMKPNNCSRFDRTDDIGPDITVWTDRGFPGASLLNKNEKYFWFHHSAGDSMLVENTANLDKGAALFAAAAFVIADLSIDIPKDVK